MGTGFVVVVTAGISLMCCELAACKALEGKVVPLRQLCCVTNGVLALTDTLT